MFDYLIDAEGIKTFMSKVAENRSPVVKLKQAVGL